MAGNEYPPAGRHPKRGESFFGGEYVEGESSATAAARNNDPTEKAEKRKLVSTAPVKEEEEEEEEEYSEDSDDDVDDDKPMMLFKKKLDANDLKQLVFDSEDYEQLQWFLTDDQKLKVSRVDDFLEVEAEDPRNNVYILHLGIWSVEKETYSLGNEWANLVTANALKRGDTVEIWDSVVEIDANQGLRLKVVISRYARPLPPRIRLLKEIARKGITIPGATGEPILLFKKALDEFDVTLALNRLGVNILCAGGLGRVLTEAEMGQVDDYVTVVTDGPSGGEYDLQLKRVDDFRGEYVLEHEWTNVVADNRLKLGDTIEGWGYRLHTQFRLKIHLFRIPA